MGKIKIIKIDKRKHKKILAELDKPIDIRDKRIKWVKKPNFL